MSIVAIEKLMSVLSRFEMVQAQLASGVEPDVYVSLSREYTALAPIAKKIEQLNGLRKEKCDLKQIASDHAADADVRGLARDEIGEISDKFSRIEHELKLLLLPKDEMDEGGIILEIRAGTGGSEAALFVSDLFRMYRRYAEINNWTLEILSTSESEMGGYREIIAAIKGSAIYKRLKHESGVHRVQRVPVTETAGRIHTSAVTVVILPEAKEVDVEILDKDLRIDIYRASGAGGQHVNKTDSAVRITHLPTGIVVAVQDERSQHKNKARAMLLLRAKIYDLRRSRDENERAENRKNQVGSGDRSQRIRTYNFPQGRLTDHRINLTLYKLERVMGGEALHEIIDAVIAENQASQLASLGD